MNLANIKRHYTLRSIMGLKSKNLKNILNPRVDFYFKKIKLVLATLKRDYTTSNFKKSRNNTSSSPRLDSLENKADNVKTILDLKFNNCDINSILQSSHSLYSPNFLKECKSLLPDAKVFSKLSTKEKSEINMKIRDLFFIEDS